MAMHPLPQHHFPGGPVCWEDDLSVISTLTGECYRNCTILAGWQQAYNRGTPRNGTKCFSIVQTVGPGAYTATWQPNGEPVR